MNRKSRDRLTYNLSGRVALVTGVSRRAGIGAAIGRALAGAGATLVTTYYRAYDASMPWGSRAEEAEAILAELREQGARAEGIEVDLSDVQAPAWLFNQVLRETGRVDILVNNATHEQEAEITEVEAVLLDRHYAVNVRAPLLLCAEFARHHDGYAGGRIVNIISGQSIGPMPQNVPYVATKAAVEGATLTLSAALASRGVTVNAVDPGPTDTGWLTDELRAELIRRAPFGRIGTPEDAARLVLFLVSDEGRWITGQILRSRGGL